MRNKLPIFALLALLCLSGCINIQRHEDHRPVVVHRHEDPPAVVYSDEDPAIREIQSAISLSLESNRYARLSSIVRRDNISPQAQVCLIETAAHELSLESNRFAIFVAMIDNPVLSDAGRNAILDHLHDLKLESNRFAVLQRLDQSGR